MPTFNYTAKEGPQKQVQGVIEAQNLDQAIQKIVSLGLTPVEVDLPQETNSSVGKIPVKASFSFFKKIRPKDIMAFTRQMCDLVEASVPILRALKVVADQTENQIFREIVVEMHKTVSDGGSLSDALAQKKDLFSDLYISMVKTGEVSGQLEKVLLRLASYLEKEQETKAKVQSSLAYPTLIMVVGILTVFVLLTFVIPRLSVMFDDLDQSLPLPTIILTSVSNIFAQYWWLMVAVIGMIGVYFNRWRATDIGGYRFDMFLLELPLVGDFIKKNEVGRFARTLATLVESGISITVALEAVWETVENRVLRLQLKRVAEDVSNGVGLGKAMETSSFFPHMAINMISVAEETGRLEKGLYKIADTYERQTDESVKTLISLLGPLVLVAIVTVVGFVVIAMLLPIFQMNTLIQ